MFGLGGHELLIFLVIATLLFGSTKIPTLMRNLGKGASEFRKGMREESDVGPSEGSKKDSDAS
jgi:sec-independent protein translocase protein TatA